MAMMLSGTHSPDLAASFRFFASATRARGGLLYSYLLQHIAEDIEAGGPFVDLLSPYRDEPKSRLMPLRLMAEMHRRVLDDELPDLVAHYPSAGGTLGPEGAWQPFREACLRGAAGLREALQRPHQHNEVARSGAILSGLDFIARETEMPLRLLEVGASAGLLLRSDRYRDAWWMPELFVQASPPRLALRVVERRGCDPSPIDPTSDYGRTRLRALVWADLVEHMRMIDYAIDVCRQVPAQVDQADGADWLPQRLSEAEPGAVSVVFHSMMVDHCSEASLSRMGAVLQSEAAHARLKAPLAWLRFEPSGPVDALEAPPTVEVRLTLWPGGDDRVLAVADTNGRGVKWLL